MRMLLVSYACLLSYSSLHASWRGAATISFWEAQDTRELVHWARDMLLAGALQFFWFVPLGFFAVQAITVGRANRRFVMRFVRISIPGLLLAEGMAFAARSLGPGISWQAARPIQMVLPAIGCVGGVWIGSAWRRGWAARLRLVPQLVLLIAVLSGGTAALAYFSVDSNPLALPDVQVTSQDKRRLVKLFRRADPRDVRRGETGTLNMTADDLTKLVNWGLSIGPVQRTGLVELEDGSATLRCSVALPPLADNRYYVNLTVGGDVQVGSGRLRIGNPILQVGRLEFNRWLLATITPLLTAMANHDRHIRPLFAAIDEFRIEPGRAHVTYGTVTLPEGFVSNLLDRIRPGADVLPATREQVRHLLGIAPDLPRGDARFGSLMESAFRLAQQRSKNADPVDENRAAIYALAILYGEPRIETLVGKMGVGMPPEDRRSLGKPTLRGRRDWVQHFLVSAALANVSNEAASNAVGLLKEDLDADGGSGFSFGDLLADRSGTTFATVATRDDVSARSLQARVVGGFVVDDYFPSAAGLPQALTDADLQAQYGGVGGTRYKEVVADIERRIADCDAYHHQDAP